MAEYYPLLAKAVGSLPNSTLETRRVVYERARKALIGQLRTLHPPVPDEDIERESVELDRAVQRLEGELAKGDAAKGGPFSPGAAPRPVPPRPPPPVLRRSEPAESAKSGSPEPARPAPARAVPVAPPRPAAAPPPPLRSKLPPARAPLLPAGQTVPASQAAPARPAPVQPAPILPAPRAAAQPAPVAAPMPRAPVQAGAPVSSIPPASSSMPGQAAVLEALPTAQAEVPAEPRDGVEHGRVEAAAPDAATEGPARFDVRRPYAPQVPAGKAAPRRVWIVPVGIGVTVAAVAVAAYALRDTRQSISRAKPTTEQAAKTDGGKIAERVGGAVPAESVARAPGAAPAAQRSATAANPEVPVAQRAALLIEAPDEPNKVKTFLGTVVWKLNNINAGPSDGVGLAVEADVDLPDDKMTAIVTFEKNTDASLPASHTIKVRFAMQPGSLSGDIQQISVPQLRHEDNPSGEALAGVTVPVVQNSFLVGLSPGNAESVNIKQLKDLQWIDIPMLLNNGKIAKLTFEKGVPGERDLNEAISSWQKS